MRALAAFMFLFLLPGLAVAVTVEGKTYPPKTTVEGVDLTLIGAGLRERFLFDVYAMGAYTKTGDCSTKMIVDTDEVKYIKLDMLRDVDAETMAEAIGESFANNMPKNAPAELKKQRQTFLGYFKKDLTQGTVLEFIYVPGIGVTVKQDGRSLGAPLAGLAFQKVFWSIYFGPQTCCKDLRQQVISVCMKK